MMDLLLWRHAEAVDGFPDHERILTRRGRDQAERVAAWLRRHQPKNLRVLASPTARTRQTAEAFTESFTIVPALGTSASPREVLRAADWPDAAAPCLIVGHQPTLGRVAALLLSGTAADWSVKKGALWWLSYRVRGDEAKTVLRAVMSPDLL